MIGAFLLALSLTILIETSVAVLLGQRNGRFLLVVLLVNIITNPLANYLIFLNQSLGIVKPVLLFVFLLEAGVVVAEWRLFVYSLPHARPRVPFLALSIAMNATSFLLGVFLFGLP